MRLINWGLIDYEAATSRQQMMAAEVAEGGEDRLIFCSHPPVVTLGRGTQPDDVFAWSGAIIETSRGGRATYHGPSQLVIYPILNLTRERQAFKPRDIHAYLRALESALVALMAELDVAAEARTSEEQDAQGRKLSVTGLWVGDKKLASIGVAIKKWVSYHGVAINLDEDPQAFAGINPCGFKREVITNLEALLGKKIERESFTELASRHLRKGLA